MNLAANGFIQKLDFSSDVINGKLDNAKKENEFVYHEKVPDFDSLPGKSRKLMRFVTLNTCTLS